MLTANIDANVRLGNEFTAISFDDLLTPEGLTGLPELPKRGDRIALIEIQSQSDGIGQIVDVDADEDLITIKLDWKQFAANAG